MGLVAIHLWIIQLAVGTDGGPLGLEPGAVRDSVRLSVLIMGSDLTLRRDIVWNSNRPPNVKRILAGNPQGAVPLRLYRIYVYRPRKSGQSLIIPVHEEGHNWLLRLESGDEVVLYRRWDRPRISSTVNPLLRIQLLVTDIINSWP